MHGHLLGEPCCAAGALGRARARRVLVDTRPSAAAAAAAPVDPFTLGVATGDPAPDGFVIWTRLAPDPLADDGLGGMPTRRLPGAAGRSPTDEALRRRRARRASRSRGPSAAHAVHVEVGGLQPGREYFYRFRAGPSPLAGRAQPDHPGARRAGRVAGDGVRVLLAATSTASSPPTATSPRSGPTWSCTSATTSTRAPANGGDARPRRRRDRDAGRLPAAATRSTRPTPTCRPRTPPRPGWWSGTTTSSTTTTPTRSPERAAEQPGFLQRRADAYQRLLREHAAAPRLGAARASTCSSTGACPWGSLATFHMLDTRQYRDDQACGDGYKDCPDASHPGRSLPGWEQEKWLLDGFRGSTATLGPARPAGLLRPPRHQPGPRGRRRCRWTPGTGTRASRQRIIDGMVDARVRNPVVLTGDVHAHWASEVLPRPGRPRLRDRRLGVRHHLDHDRRRRLRPGRRARTPGRRTTRTCEFYTNLRGYVCTTITPDVDDGRLPVRAAR